jgi:dihydrofolate synthase / folylpolyglutamate synthase
LKKQYLDFLYRLGVFNIKLGLENINNILGNINNPQQHPRIIHIAGTNGKGSTLVTIEKLLLESGCSTGATISPHLVSFNERFRINGESISDDLLNEAFLKVCEACDIDINNLENYSGESTINPTFFEFALTMAFYAFHQKKVDYILLETGLGGRLDASNVVENPIACVFTKIDYDHQEFLGDTLELITNEKLGILKTGAKVFVAQQQQCVTDQILTVCRDRAFECYTAGQNFSFQPEEAGAVSYCFKNLISIINQNKQISNKIRINEMALVGEHQQENVATAIAVYFSVIEENKRLSNNQIKTSLKKINWPGRIQYLNTQKSILLDGAHNICGMRSLLSYLAQNHSADKILFATTWMEGKEIIPALDEFDLSRVTFLPVKIEMVGTAQIKNVSDGLIQKGYQTLPMTNSDDLIAKYVHQKTPEYDLVLIAGSLYLLGEVLTKINNESD